MPALQCGVIVVETAPPSYGGSHVQQFVADGTWQHDPTHKTEKDHEGNTNNVLYPDDITSSSLAGAAISSVGPGAT
jgi:hypothetical protein